MTPAIEYGIRLFNEHRFFEAHEALEEIWLKEHGQTKTFLHGLIQIAAAFHHYSRANLAGFCSLMDKGCKKLNGCAGEAFPIEWAAFRRELEDWRHFLAALEDNPCAQPPSPPQIVMKTRASAQK